jgi:hypothetical protein
MSLRTWLEQHAPDFVETGRRFPFAILLAAATTAVALFVINNSAASGEETWYRAAAGLATAAVLAVAGVFFAESRPQAIGLKLVLKYLVPLAVAGLFLIRDGFWVFPWLLLPVSILWLSVSPFTHIGRGPERETQQNLFWWVNHQAVATAAIAAAAFLIVAIGLGAIERSLALLFGLDVSVVFYRWVLPVTGLFLTPVYWLSTLPRVETAPRAEIENPDFTATAVGFLGQFILVPLLLVYAAILLAYTAQIVITGQLPQGTIGWMVLGFVVAGAGCWLVLHPPFMRNRPLVRVFRRIWFWLTLIPLALFFYAVQVRLGAYGFTPERMLLLAGGTWASVLALVFLLRRGDVRLIPALAGAILLVLSVGPWNLENLPNSQQAARLEALLVQPGANGASFPPAWTSEQTAEAGSAMAFLSATESGRARLTTILQPYGLDYSAPFDSVSSVIAEIGYTWPVSDGSTPTTIYLRRAYATQPVDVSATPILIGPLSAYAGGRISDLGIDIATNSTTITVSRNSQIVVLELARWLARQPMADGEIVEPWLDFPLDGTNYRIVVDSISLDRTIEGLPTFYNLYGMLFASAAP